MTFKHGSTRVFFSATKSYFKNSVESLLQFSPNFSDKSFCECINDIKLFHFTGLRYKNVQEIPGLRDNISLHPMKSRDYGTKFPAIPRNPGITGQHFPPSQEIPGLRDKIYCHSKKSRDLTFFSLIIYLTTKELSCISIFLLIYIFLQQIRKKNHKIQKLKFNFNVYIFIIEINEIHILIKEKSN